MRILRLLLVAYGAASLLHHVHNAEFLKEYPSMPAWLSPAWIYAAWLAIAAVAVVGYFLVHCGFRLTGLVALAACGMLGLDGFSHYTLAPLSAHTFTMNLTIWLEVSTAALLLITVAGLLLSQRGSRLTRGSGC